MCRKFFVIVCRFKQAIQNKRCNYSNRSNFIVIFPSYPGTLVCILDFLYAYDVTRDTPVPRNFSV
jgi:hypothetical protein